MYIFEAIILVNTVIVLYLLCNHHSIHPYEVMDGPNLENIHKQFHENYQELCFLRNAVDSHEKSIDIMEGLLRQDDEWMDLIKGQEKLLGVISESMKDMVDDITALNEELSVLEVKISQIQHGLPLALKDQYCYNRAKAEEMDRISKEIKTEPESESFELNKGLLDSIPETLVTSLSGGEIWEVSQDKKQRKNDKKKTKRVS
jgi:hypothetical protein